ncbi:MAG: UDP-glucose 4-epimerase GalE [Lentisphaeria bacterium]|nr:UDP-glucose 4-epimerase GalE [Lentisphaeria bacterium]
MNSILITGGAGYIGSHTVRQLASNYQVVVIDNLVYGHKDAIVDSNVLLVEGDLGDTELVRSLFTEYGFDAVIHFAAYAYVGESVTEPAKYYQNNTAAPLNLLDVMNEFNCKKFIFSSTCATYGNPIYVPIDEKHPQAPINPYGQSKLMLEKILMDYDYAYGIKSVRLRYFNACGASQDAVIGEDHDPETHLIPLALMSVKGEFPQLTVFGTDYPTPDGTCIRDYIHVEDLGRAHVLAYDYLTSGGDSLSCNLGTGRGVSVKEIIDTCKEVTGQEVPHIYGERRAGDPPELVADPTLAKEKLGWVAKHKDVKDSIQDAWNWMEKAHGGRYAK